MKFSALVVASVASLFLGSVSMAGHHEMGPCRDEVKKLCPDMKMGKGLGKCIEEKKSQLSPECQEKFTEKKEHMKEKVHDFGKACKDDVKKLCADVQKGEGLIIECLKSKSAELSAACKEKIDRH